MAYFYIINNQQYGPCKAEELLQNGVTTDTFVWAEGMADWQKAGSVSALQHLFPQASTPPPPPIPNQPPHQGAPHVQQQYFSNIPPTAEEEDLIAHPRTPEGQQIKHKYKQFSIFYWVGWGFLLIGSLAFPLLVELDILRWRYDEEYFTIIIIMSILLQVPAIVFSMQILYRTWANIEQGYARTSPGNAVGFLFIPFFNLYWVFQAYWGLAIDLNRYMIDRGLSKRKWLDETFALAYAIVVAAQILPIIGYLAILGNLVLTFIMFNKLHKASILLMERRYGSMGSN